MRKRKNSGFPRIKSCVMGATTTSSADVSQLVICQVAERIFKGSFEVILVPLRAEGSISAMK